ncbi:MAG: Hpt domain-containing protein, partial [Desulfofustis sp.]|nr:Hpt domain-containing protein [Desulfofustis sp.]
MHIEDDEILQGFIEESLEHLADIENDLLSIEETAENVDEDLVNKVFRAAHSIKGGAGFMGLTTIQELSHAMENVLGMIRSKTLVPTPEIVNLLLLASDQLQRMIEDIQNSNEVDIEAHLKPLNAIANHEFSQPAGKAAVPKKTGKSAHSASQKATEVRSSPPVEPAVEEVSSATDSEPAKDPIDDLIVDEVREEGLDQDNDQHDEIEDSELPDVLLENAAVKDNGGAKTKMETSIRVHVSLLDQLMTLAGELVLSRNQLLQTIGGDDFRNMEAVGQRIDLITSELQEAIMLTRMQPIGNVFNKFPRVVRDLSKKLGKRIDLTIIGKDVELDKTIIEAINDPLTHLVRNSVDHGIELPDERKKSGKSETGVVLLKAFHEAGQVVIEIVDDGRGI